MKWPLQLKKDSAVQQCRCDVSPPPSVLGLGHASLGLATYKMDSGLPCGVLRMDDGEPHTQGKQATEKHNSHILQERTHPFGMAPWADLHMGPLGRLAHGSILPGLCGSCTGMLVHACLLRGSMRCICSGGSGQAFRIPHTHAQLHIMCLALHLLWRELLGSNHHGLQGDAARRHRMCVQEAFCLTCGKMSLAWKPD